jgi:hypothetical protein
MLMDKNSLNCGGRHSRPFAMSTGNPATDRASGGVVNATTPNRVKTSALPIAIPDSQSGSRKRNGSPQSVQSGTFLHLFHSLSSVYIILVGIQEVLVHFLAIHQNRALTEHRLQPMGFFMLVPSSVRLLQQLVFPSHHLIGPLPTRISSKKCPII